MPRDFANEQIEVLRAADGPSGGPLPAHSRIGGDAILRLLVDGRTLIAKGWTRGAFHTSDYDGDGHCARGVLYPSARGPSQATIFFAARTMDRKIILAEGALFGALSNDWLRMCYTTAFYDAGDFVAAFNDLPETTHADVLALFDRAIAACKSELAQG